jgi:hypothetical protein
MASKRVLFPLPLGPSMTQIPSLNSENRTSIVPILFLSKYEEEKGKVEEKRREKER